ncbi:MAG: N-acetylmuramoyl-L-alanine amidase [Xanthomonadaceae bacterium]|nr:N-acetylmuramoyl-L-alanine amidase [Xanthomonadaceae bacterium]
MIENPLPYVDRLQSRNPETIARVVIHATELPDLKTAREDGERILYPKSGTGNSGHFYIDRDGRIEQWVPLGRVAHHVRDHNADAIGIELVNQGRWPDWFDSRHQNWKEPYPAAQIQALIELLGQLERKMPALSEIAGHDQLDHDRIEASDNPDVLIRRKTDPGPEFPWTKVLSAIGLQRYGER